MVNTKDEKMRKLTWEHGLFCVSAYLKQDGETADQFRRCCYFRVSALFWRVPILLWAVGVLGWSTSTFWGPPGMYLLYMTHWGLVLIVIETTLGIMVAANQCYGQLPDANEGLPWYVKAYWVLYNVTIPVSFLITIFYWGVLKTSDKIVNYAPNPILDLMLHGVNSCVMFVELASSAHPSKLIHIMQPLYFGLAYLLFTVFYFLAGGNDPWGNSFIYPVIDWNKPDQTMVVLTLTAIFLALMHLLVVGVATVRDVIARQCNKSSLSVYNEGLQA